MVSSSSVDERRGHRPPETRQRQRWGHAGRGRRRERDQPAGSSSRRLERASRRLLLGPMRARQRARRLACSPACAAASPPTKPKPPLSIHPSTPLHTPSPPTTQQQLAAARDGGHAGRRGRRPLGRPALLPPPQGGRPPLLLLPASAHPTRVQGAARRRRPRRWRGRRGDPRRVAASLRFASLPPLLLPTLRISDRGWSCGLLAQ